MRLKARIRMHLRVASMEFPHPYTPLGKRKKGIRDVDQHQQWGLKVQWRQVKRDILAFTKFSTFRFGAKLSSRRVNEVVLLKNFNRRRRVPWDPYADPPFMHVPQTHVAVRVRFSASYMCWSTSYISSSLIAQQLTRWQPRMTGKGAWTSMLTRRVPLLLYLLSRFALMVTTCVKTDPGILISASNADMSPSDDTTKSPNASALWPTNVNPLGPSFIPIP
jgi:hypothetical protein